MKKLVKALLSVGVLATTFTGCYTNNSSSFIDVAPPDVEVWSTYSTAKVIQDPEYNINHTKLAPVLDVASCLGEEEDGQLIITANERVNWYSLKTSELKTSSGDVFSLDNIWVYNQFYHEIYLKSQGRTDNQDVYPLGFTPDALTPQAGSEENKENFIEAGNNQGITVTFNVPSNQEPGVYTGTFTLLVDGYKKAIPVRLTIWNIDNTYMHGYTAMDLWGSGRPQVELDTINFENWSRSVNEAEYNFWVSKRINPMRIPADTGGPEAWAENVAELWSNPRFNSFVFDDMRGNKQKIKEYVMALVKVADRDQINYIEAASFYEKEADEPTPGSEHMTNCINWTRNTMEALEEIATEVENDPELFSEDKEFKAEIVQSIRGIRFLITSPYENLPEDTLAQTNALSPQLDAFATEERRAYYDTRVENENFTVFTYTCMFPTYPLPSQAIDDYSLGLRVLGWMRKDYNIEGYLNWDGNMSYWRNPYYSGRDPYEDVLRLYLDGLAMFLNGDGFFTYPGKRYNQIEPVGSIRLNALRDMQEDYDMLCVFEEQYDNLVNKYGANAQMFDSNKLLTSLYDSLYEGLNYYLEEVLVLKAREQLASWMEGMSESGLLFNYTTQGENVKVSLYSDADEVYINGIKTQGTAAKYGKNYQKLLALEDGNTEISVRVVKDGKESTHLYSVGAKNYIAMKSDTLTAEKVTLSKGSSYDAQTGVFTMKSGGDTLVEQLTFRVQAKIAFDQPILKEDMDSLYVEYFNDNDFDVKVRFGYYSGVSTYMVETYIVKANSSAILTDLSVYGTEEWSKSTIDGFVLVFENMDEEQVLLPDRKFRLGDITYTKTKGGE